MFKVFYFIIIYNFISSKSFEYTNDDINKIAPKRISDSNGKSVTPGQNINKKPDHIPTKFEIKAVLVKCVNTHCPYPQFKPPSPLKKTVSFVRETDTKISSGSSPKKIKKCHKKILVTIQITNKGQTNSKNQYVVIDHVYDPLTDRKIKLFNPYIIKLRQLPVTQSYNLIFDQLVNSKAREEVHSKAQPDYQGCNVGKKNPTCEPIIHNSKEVPFSTGFCCSCNVKKNEQHADPLPAGDFFNQLDDNDPEALISILNSDSTNTPGFEDVPEPVTYDAQSILQSLTSSEPNLNNSEDIFGNFVNTSQECDDHGSPLNFGTRRRRRMQQRGGQDCEDRYTPPKADPRSYHDSTHCLKFSDVWYAVYHLEKPTLHHSVQLQVFERFEDQNCNVRWRDILKGPALEVGSEKTSDQNAVPTVAVNYKRKETSDKFHTALDVNNHKILIPETLKSKDILQYPEVTGGVPEYLVVPKNLITVDGKECNKAGVGFQAFYKQPKRCSVPQGSCLGNQPSDFWNHDHKAECEGKKGSYFLKFFGNLPPKPISENCDDHTQSISLYYECDFSSTLELEFNADHNTLLKPHISAMITEVYIDSTGTSGTRMKAKITNTGLISSIFYITLTDCPLDMPASFNNIGSKPVLIPPQRQHIFNLNIQCTIPSTQFFCTLQVLNTKKELIAIRRMRILKSDRCICIWHCKCTCLSKDNGFKCRPMAIENYNAAGFQGSLPVATHLVEYTFMDDVLSILVYFFLFLCSTLLIMGLTKALIGWFCCVSVGLWGFDVLLNLPKKIGAYYEPHLRNRQVEYSSSGWPVHPDTKERVRNIPPATEFCVNVIFFFVYPVILFVIIVKKFCCTSYARNESEQNDAENEVSQAE